MKYIVGVLAIILFVIALLNIEPNRTVVYDCRLAEISPDYPVEVKNACRKIRYEQWKKSYENQI